MSNYLSDGSKKEIASFIGSEVNKVLDPFMALLKSLEGPASKAGMSPTEFVSKMTNDGKQSGHFDPSGRFHPTRHDPHGRRIGDVYDPASGKTLNFGQYLTDMVDYSTNGPRAQKSMERLDSYGVKAIVNHNAKDGSYTKAALAESSGVAGGYTVPPVFLAQLMAWAVEESLVQSRATKYPLESRTLQIPSLDQVTKQGAGNSNLLGGVIASWTSEAATRSETEPIFKQTTLTAWELSFISIASNTLLQDNAIGMDTWLTQLFSKAIAWYTDYAFFQGDGVGKPLGILNSAANIQVTRKDSSHFRFQDVGNMLAKLYWPMRADNDIAWVMHQSVIADLFALSDYTGSTAGTGRLVFQPFNQGAQEAIPQSAGVQSAGYLAGYPVLITEKVPALGTAGDVNLIHFPSYVLGQRMELELAVSPHYKFANNQLTWRAVWRGDGTSWLQGAITLADGTKSVSPFISLL
jgi:HK97 family phage major capsid protein